MSGKRLIRYHSDRTSTALALLALFGFLALAVPLASAQGPGTSGTDPAPYRDAVLADNPAAYWRLGEAAGATTAADATGHGHNGTYRNGVTPGADGALARDTDTAAEFPGTTPESDVLVPDADGLDFGGGNFTVEAWVRTEVTPAENFIASKYDGSPSSWRVSITDDTNFTGRVRAKVNDGVSTTTAYGPSIRVDDGDWHHVVVVVDRSWGIRIYVDGIASETRVAIGGTVSNQVPIRIGSAWNEAPLTGTLDEVAVYPSALSPARIRAHSAVADLEFDPPPFSTAVKADTPVGYWRLGEASGATIAKDSSGNGLDGVYGESVSPGVPGGLRSDRDTAANFHGVDGDGQEDSVDVPDDPRLDFGTGDFAVEAWVKTTANLERPVVTKSLGSNVGPNWHSTVTDDAGYAGRARIKIYDGSVIRYAYGPDIRIDDGRWHHVVFVAERGWGVVGYVDGVGLENPGAMTGDVSNDAQFRIGDTANHDPLNGDVDEVAAYPRSLDPWQVVAHYEAGMGDPPAPYGHAVASHAPVAQWRLGDAAGTAVARDSGPNNLDGTYRNGAAPGAEGALTTEADTAASFPAAPDANVLVDDHDRLDFGSGDFSVEAWVKTTVAPTDDTMIVSKYAAATPHWQLTATNDSGHFGEARLKIEDGTASIRAYGPAIRLDDGQWHHVAAVADRDSGVAVYVDGVGRFTQNATPGSISNAAPVRIGASPDYWSWNGSIDEVALYDYALPPEHVRVHLASGRPPAPYASVVTAASPRGYWRLGEPAEATTAADASGNGHSGTYRRVRTGIPGGLGSDDDTAMRMTVDEPGYDGVDFGDLDAFDVGTEDFSVAAWIKTTRAQENPIVSKSDDTLPKWYVSVTDDGEYAGRARAKIHTPNVMLVGYGPAIRVDDGRWHHVVAVYDRDTELRVYVDGIEQSTPGQSLENASNAARLGIGDEVDHPAFHGDIDEVAIFPRTLSASEVGKQFVAGEDGRLGEWESDGDDKDTPGVVRTGSNGYSWNLTNELGGPPLHVFDFRSNGTPIAGDWDGDGVDTSGVVIGGNHWILSDGYGGEVDYDFYFGNPGDAPVVGDWNSDGRDTPGVRRGHTFYLSDDFGGSVNYTVPFGNDQGDEAIAGDWNGDGVDTIGVRRGNWWFLSDTFSSTVDHSFAFGNPSGDDALVGDWDGNGSETIGVRRGATWYLSNDLSGTVHHTFTYGNPTGDSPVTGDWSTAAFDPEESPDPGPGSPASKAGGPLAPESTPVPSVVQQYAPFIWLEETESSWPSTVGWFLARSELKFRRERGWGRRDVHQKVAGWGQPYAHNGWLGENGPPRSGHPWRVKRSEKYYIPPDFTRPLDSSEDRNDLAGHDGFYLNIRADHHGGNAQLAQDPIYYQYEQNRYILYWFFYPNNVGTSGFNHEGDWEHIVIKLGPNDAPERIALFQHGCQPDTYGFANYPKLEGTQHPILFAARGAHGVYRTMGRPYRDRYGRVMFHGHPVKCLRHILPPDRTNKGHAWHAYQDVRRARQPWYGFGGAWGEIGNFRDTTGPLGPSVYKLDDALPTGW